MSHGTPAIVIVVTDAAARASWVVVPPTMANAINANRSWRRSWRIGPEISICAPCSKDEEGMLGAASATGGLATSVAARPDSLRFTRP
jgi:hypothetical protein